MNKRKDISGDIANIDLNSGFFDDSDESQNEIQRIETELIYIEPQFRKSFDPEEFEKLKTSIKDNGFDGCIAVKRLDTETKKDLIADLRQQDSSKSDQDERKKQIRNSNYLLIYGETRLRAVKALHKENPETYPDTIPALVKPESTDRRQIRRLRADENLARNDFNPLEEAETILAMMADEIDKREEDVISVLNQHVDASKGKADAPPHDVVGKLRAVLHRYKKTEEATLAGFLNTYRGLRNLPVDVLHAMQDSDAQKHLPYTKAIELKSIKDDKQRTELLQEILKNKLTIKQIRERKRKLRDTSKKNTSIPDGAAPIIRALQNESIWKKLKQDPKKLKSANKLLEKFETDLSKLFND